MADYYDPDLLQTERPSDTPVVKVRPKRAGPRDEKSDKNSSGDDGYDPSISKPMQGLLDHIKGGESGGKYNIIYGGQTFDPDKGHPRIAVPIKEGPNKGKTSSAAGAYQFIGSTWDAVAQKTGRKDMSRASQDINAIQLAKDTYKEQTGRDIEKDWASGDPELKKGIDRALGTQWESLASGPRVSNLDASGHPKMGFGFSDYAMKEHEGRTDTNIHWMSPEDYLGLSPEFKEKPFESPSGRSLMQSFRKGDHIESIPTLDVNVHGDTATVTEQDGRHRALLAQQEGIKEIPVAVRGIGENNPSQIAGMRGDKRPLELPERKARQEAPEQERSPIGMLRDAIMPRAEAAELPEGFTMSQKAPAGELPAGFTMSQTGGEAPQETPPQQGFMGKMGGAIADAAVNAIVPGSGLMFPHPGNSPIVSPDNAAAAARGLAPYAAGAGIGAGIGALAGGVGAVPGAIAGAGAVGLDQLATGLAGLPGPQQATNALLDRLGVRPSDTPEQRVIEQMTSGAANAFTGAGAASLLAATMKSPASKVAANWLMNKGASVNDTVRQVAGSLAQSPGLQAVSGAFSGAGAQLAAEAGLPQSMQTLVGMAAGLVPGGKGMAGNWRRIDASPEAKKAIEAGFAIPPAEASEGHIGKFNASNALAAEGGKVKTQQLASAQNQIVVDRKVAADLGLPPDTTMFPEAYDAVRSREGQVYREVERAVPQVDLTSDPIYRDAVKDVGKDLKQLVEMFPHVKSSPELGSQILTFEDDLLRNSTGDTPTVMKYIAELRRQMTDNYRKPNNALAHRLADAQRNATSELENALERSVQNAPQYYRAELAKAQKYRDDQYRERARSGLPLQGPMIEQADAAVQNWSDKLANANAKNQNNQTLMDRFREARRVMAKSYDAESVTNPSNGHVSGTGLGRLKKRGKPLSGALEEIADAANNFQKAFQNPAAFGGVEPLSVLDLAFAGGNAAKALAHASTGNFGGALAHAMAAIPPFLRPFGRRAQLSPEYQKQMISDPRGISSAPLGGFTGAMLPTQPVPGNPGGNALMGLTTQQ